MAKIYNRINWQNSPSTSTPLNAANLNKMDKGIDEIDTKLDNLQTTVDNLPSGGGGGNANILEITQTKYDNLPDTKLTDNILYLIKKG